MCSSDLRTIVPNLRFMHLADITTTPFLRAEISIYVILFAVLAGPLLVWAVMEGIRRWDAVGRANDTLKKLAARRGLQPLAADSAPVTQLDLFLAYGLEPSGEAKPAAFQGQVSSVSFLVTVVETNQATSDASLEAKRASAVVDDAGVSGGL